MKCPSLKQRPSHFLPPPSYATAQNTLIFSRVLWYTFTVSISSSHTRRHNITVFIAHHRRQVCILPRLHFALARSLLMTRRWIDGTGRIWTEKTKTNLGLALLLGVT